MANAKISVVYVNYNTQDLLEDSLRSVVKNIVGYDYEVIVVDNASKSFDVGLLKKIFSNVMIVQEKKNLGFGDGNNTGAKVANGKYIWLLNTDTLVPQGNHLDKVIEFLDTHIDYAAATPLLVNDKDNKQAGQIAHFPSVWRMVAEKPVKLIVKFLPFTHKFFGSLNPSYVPDKDCDVDQAVAASLVVRKSAFDEVGGFSPEYFMYYEDTDLCKKLAMVGYKVRFVPEAKIVHLLGGSITTQHERKQRYFEAQDIYFGKWKSGFSQMTVKVLRLPIKAIYRLKGKKK